MLSHQNNYTNKIIIRLLLFWNIYKLLEVINKIGCKLIIRMLKLLLQNLALLIMLVILYIYYFNDPRKLFSDLYLVKLLNTLSKSFFPCMNAILNPYKILFEWNIIFYTEHVWRYIYLFFRQKVVRFIR